MEAILQALPQRILVLPGMFLYEMLTTVAAFSLFMVSIPIKVIRFVSPVRFFDQACNSLSWALCLLARPFAGVPRNVEGVPVGVHGLATALGPDIQRPREGEPDLHCLCALSALAYEDLAVVQAQCSVWNNVTFLQFVNVVNQPFINWSGPVDTQAFLFLKGKTLVVCFRGTSPLEMVDWGSDFSMSMDATGQGQPGRVHRGFRLALGLNPTGPVAGGAYDQIVRFISSSSVSFDSVIVTGHSLGGALAMVFGAQFFQVTRPKQSGQIVTFGGPRVGNSDFAAGVDALRDRVTVTRVVNGNDLVPRECPRALGFRHPGDVIHIETDGRRLVMQGADREQPPLRWGTAVIKLLWGVQGRRENVLRLGFRVLVSLE